MDPMSKNNANEHNENGHAFSDEDRRRIDVIHQVMRKWLTPDQAGEMLQISSRQILRLVRRVREEGEAGIVHRLKGRPSNHMLPSQLKQKILEMYRTRYAHLGPTAAHRTLSKAQNIRLNRETLRRWLLAAGLWCARP